MMELNRQDFPESEKVDMWALALLLLEMRMGSITFPWGNSVNAILVHCNLLFSVFGEPNEERKAKLTKFLDDAVLSQRSGYSENVLTVTE